jgi:molecular chaperone GrpE
MPQVRATLWQVIVLGMKMPGSGKQCECMNRSVSQEDTNEVHRNDAGTGVSGSHDLRDGMATNEKPAGEGAKDRVGEDALHTEGQSAEVQTEEDALRSLKEQLENKASEAEENWKQFLRARADADNLRKRIERDLPVMVRREKKDMFLKILDVIDNFERAIAGGKNVVPDGDSAAKAFLQGVEIIYRQMLGILEDEGIKPIEATGQPFDPALHEAISSEEKDGISTEVVAQELQKGYLYQGEVLRASRVRVAVPTVPESSRSD